MKNYVRRKVVWMSATAAVLLSLAGGIAYATIPDSGSVYTACLLNRVGTIRLIDPSLGRSSPMGHCTPSETQITWNQQGQKGDPGPRGPQGQSGPQGRQGIPGSNGTNGTNGLSVTSTSLNPGDSNCANGGSSFTSASGTTYACNGAPGAPGAAAPAPALNVQMIINQVAFTGGGLQEVDATCPSGTTLIGGGAGADNENVNMIDSNPDLPNNRWQVVYYLGQPSTIVARALCATLTTG